MKKSSLAIAPKILPLVLLGASAAAPGAGALAQAPETPATLQVEDRAVVLVNALAAAIAAAQSIEEIEALVLAAREDGLGDDQIGFAFGIAEQLSAAVDLVISAYEAFLAEAGADDDDAPLPAAVEPLTAAFAEGEEAVESGEDPSETSGGDEDFFQGAPLGAGGYQGGDIGGGGASPK